LKLKKLGVEVVAQDEFEYACSIVKTFVIGLSVYRLWYCFETCVQERLSPETETEGGGRHIMLLNGKIFCQLKLHFCSYN